MISRSEAVAFSMGDLGRASDFRTLPEGDLGGASTFLTFLGEALAFSTFPLGTTCRESGSAPLTFPVCSSAACREMNDSVKEIFDSFVGMCSLYSDRCSLVPPFERRCFKAIFIAGPIDGAGEPFIVIFLTSES